MREEKVKDFLELNTRQKAIIALLTERNGSPIKLEEICDELCDSFEELLYIGGKTPFNNSRPRRILTDDIKVINDLSKNTLIANDNYSGVFVVNETNYKNYLEREKNKILRMLSRYYRKARKMASLEELAKLTEEEKKMYELMGE